MGNNPQIELTELTAPEAKIPVVGGINLAELIVAQNIQTDGPGAPTYKAIERFIARKPHAQEFVRVDSRPESTAIVYGLKRKEDGDIYLVHPTLVQHLPGVYQAQLFLTTNKQGAVFVWAIQISPSTDGKMHTAHTSALEAAELAKNQWTKLIWKREANSYEAESPRAHFPDPVWPQKSLSEIVQIAFKDFYIDSKNHILFRQILGEV